MIKVGIIGVGTVGTSVAQILKDNADVISARSGTDIMVKSGVVKNLNKERGLDIVLTDNVDHVLNDTEIDIVVELMGGVEEPFDVVKRALENGKAVVTANKALLAYHRYELQTWLRSIADPNRAASIYIIILISIFTMFVPEILIIPYMVIAAILIVGFSIQYIFVFQKHKKIIIMIEKLANTHLRG